MEEPLEPLVLPESTLYIYRYAPLDVEKNMCAYKKRGLIGVADRRRRVSSAQP